MAKKKLVTKVLCCLVVMVILVSTMPTISSNSASGTFELLRNGHNDIGPKHKYLDCGENVNYFDISVLFNWEDSGVERLKIDASTGESFESGLYPTACGEDVFILDSACGKITLNYDGWKSDSDGWHYKYSYTIEESDSKPSLSISVWTDKSEYKIGETVKIYYKTNKKCTAKLTITKPDGEKIVYGPNEIPACTRSKSATAGYPTGKRTVVFEAWAGGKYKKATCYFDVADEKKPDLTVSSINFNPNPANKYEDVIVSVTVKNRGKGDAGSHYEFLGYPDRYTILKEWYCSGLKAGASKTFTHTLKNVQHSDTYEACADWGQAVQESDDDNNCLTAFLEVKESEKNPDLTITDLSWSHDSPTSLDLVTYTVEIKNIGTATAEKFWIKILFDDDAEDIDIVASLDPGNSYSQKFYVRKNCGSYSIKAIVDPDDFIKEINDNNNIMEKPISIDCGDSIERALIIGISNYQYAPDLGQQAVNSAKGMYNLLSWGYGYDPENVILLLDNEATFRTIKDEINDMGKITDKNDKIVFYYTGHAARSPNKEEGIVPYDVLVNDGKLDSNMCILDLDKHFDKNYQGQNVFDGDLIAIFDTCYSGGFCKETDIDDGVPSGINGDKRVVLMSTKAGEKLSPWELHYLKFTRYLLDAFASHSNEADLNDDLRISAEEAFEYAKYRGWVLGWLQHPQIMDHYLDESNREAELHISNELVVDEIIAGEGGSSVHIHAYDTEGKHVGTADSGNIVSEIPGAWYSGPDSHPEEIIIFGISEDITFTIEGQIDETFNFTIRQFTDVNDIIINYDDVPIKENTIATVAVSKANPTYTMEIDNNGDGTTDYTKEPDSIETIGAESPVHNLNTGEDFATIQNAIDDPDTQDWHTITVDPGTCTEQLVIDKSLKLMGEDKNTTIIEGGGINGSCVHITADNVEISGFTIRKGVRGVYLESSNESILDNNIISDNEEGIYLINSNNNMITNNSLFNNVLSLSGIHLSSSHNNVIRDNDLVENDIGVSLRDSNNNLIYHNNFIDNIIRQAFDDTGTNSWDKGPLEGGNYWSDHSCIGTPSDKSYSIYSDGVDHYPFQDQNGWLKGNQPPVTSGNAGAISVSSSPSGAAIHLEGFVGPSIKTPYTITNVPVGMSTITLSLDGYLDWSTSVYVMAGKTSYVDATLTPIQTAGPISVASSINISHFLRLIK